MRRFSIPWILNIYYTKGWLNICLENSFDNLFYIPFLITIIFYKKMINVFYLFFDKNYFWQRTNQEIINNIFYEIFYEKVWPKWSFFRRFFKVKVFLNNFSKWYKIDMEIHTFYIDLGRNSQSTLKYVAFLQTKMTHRHHNNWMKMAN